MKIRKISIKPDKNLPPSFKKDIQRLDGKHQKNLICIHSQRRCITLHSIMKFSNVIVAISCAASAQAAFVTNPSATIRPSLVVNGYLDDLSEELYKEDATPDVQADLRESNQMSKGEVDRFGPGNLNDFVDFDEFDGGDGQMGVAGDGSGTGLDKSEFETGSIAGKSMNNSRDRSARNAWGTNSSGYAEELRSKGVDTARAQQLENWASQQEITKQKNEQRRMTETFDRQGEIGEADWRTLASFGVERNTVRAYFMFI